MADAAVGAMRAAIHRDATSLAALGTQHALATEAELPDTAWRPRPASPEGGDESHVVLDEREHTIDGSRSPGCRAPPTAPTRALGGRLPRASAPPRRCRCPCHAGAGQGDGPNPAAVARQLTRERVGDSALRVLGALRGSRQPPTRPPRGPRQPTWRGQSHRRARRRASRLQADRQPPQARAGPPCRPCRPRGSAPCAGSWRRRRAS